VIKPVASGVSKTEADESACMDTVASFQHPANSGRTKIKPLSAGKWKLFRELSIFLGNFRQLFLLRWREKLRSNMDANVTVGY
jgi:hypothetical protein